MIRTLGEVCLSHIWLGEENILGYGEILGKTSICATPGHSEAGKCEGVLARDPRKTED